MSNVRFIGLDVHAETIAVAAAEPTGEVRSLGVIAASATSDAAFSRTSNVNPKKTAHGGKYPDITNELV